MLKRALEAMGYTVVTVPDGRVALSVLEENHFDRVFLDVMMPHVDGFEVLRWIRAHPTKKQTWVCLLTPMAQDRQVFERLPYRADHHVHYPYTTVPLIP